MVYEYQGCGAVPCRDRIHRKDAPLRASNEKEGGKREEKVKKREAG